MQNKPLTIHILLSVLCYLCDNMDREEQLKQRIAQSDKTAFAVVFRAYYGKVFKFVHSIVKDESQAEDLAQEVFIKLWSKRKNLATVQSLDNYLFIISRNISFDYLRKAFRKKRVSIDVLDSFIMSQISVEQQSTQEAKSELDQVRRAVFQMPSRRRDIYLMSRFDGYSNSDIADIMGISRKTVENQLYLASDELKKIRS